MTAKFHLMELPIYVVMLFFLAKSWGITGVAVAWLLRVTIDAFLLFWFSFRLLPECRFIITRLPLMITGAMALNLAVALITGLTIKILIACVIFLIALPALWLWMFTPAQRAPFIYLLQRLKK
jgi:hypothetical protein